MNSPYQRIIGVKSIGGVSFPSGDITGSCHWVLLQTRHGVEANLYDFWLFQGAEKKRTEDFPPEFLRAKSGVIGHSHADHSQRLGRFMYERQEAWIDEDIVFLGSDVVRELYLPIGLQWAAIAHNENAFLASIISGSKKELDTYLNNWRWSFGRVRRVAKSQKPRWDHKKKDLLAIAERHALPPEYYESILVAQLESTFLRETSKFRKPDLYKKIIDIISQVPESEEQSYKKLRNLLLSSISKLIHDFFEEEKKKLPPDLRLFVSEASRHFKESSVDDHGREYYQINPFLRVDFYNTAHTLWSRGALYTVTLENWEKRRLFFMGDVGRDDNTSFLGNPEFPEGEIDFCTMEGTYAGKPDHPEREPEIRQLQDFILWRTRQAIMMPVFQFQRAQDMALILDNMRKKWDIPSNHQILMSGSLFSTINDTFWGFDPYSESFWPWEQHVQIINRKQKEAFKAGKLSNTTVLTAGWSADIWASLEFIPHARNVILCWYQFPGSIGARLAAGEEVECTNVNQDDLLVLRSFSGHASESQLLRYAEQIKWKTLSLVHGTPENLTALSAKIPLQDGQRVVVPEKGELISVD